MFCPNCGKNINDGASFCSNCGWKKEEKTNKQNVVSTSNVSTNGVSYISSPFTWDFINSVSNNDYELLLEKQKSFLYLFKIGKKIEKVEKISIEDVNADGIVMLVLQKNLKKIIAWLIDKVKWLALLFFGYGIIGMSHVSLILPYMLEIKVSFKENLVVDSCLYGLNTFLCILYSYFFFAIIFEKLLSRKIIISTSNKKKYKIFVNVFNKNKHSEIITYINDFLNS